MAYQELFEDDLLNGTTLWRYLPLNRFLQILETKSLYLPTASSYEDTDLNEGRFTESYVNVTRNWVKIGQTLTPEEETTEVEIALSRILAAREASYISCWTSRDYEDERMWKSFGGDFKGVALKTTVGKIADELFEYCARNEPFDLVLGRIKYDRQNMHKMLNIETIISCHFPMFFLDGGEWSFEHEQECRFVLYDPMEISDVAAELLSDGLVKAEGTIKLTDSYRLRVASTSQSGILVPISLENMLLEVVLGSEVSIDDKILVHEILKSKKIEVKCSESQIQRSK